ncbi:NAD(P)/FAD-dependent oxidoreductase [Methylobacterium gregans]|uniref:Rhodocoxin reductase n=1 Tax=Methylobacterium gregans TaxID=374424 RepID=A0AA37HQW2_9HYPH|nr:FAD-dependent oxidoreductase [Methylobacterium gregans]MDQ0519514.1 NADPH-dependent 2,4-dienoyl-CoA reductase/sulfur reductase-like enzyme [Methylobacterium gregans]GJD79288.1 Rhodocoxin reductase [Methylobacterium gregans]GLS52845.1 ferredoxin reductase [Methylobacterium gregans]
MSGQAGIVVVGASLAGLRGAEALRLGGYEGPLTLVGDEPHRPYDRPPLSKHVLAGELAADATALPQRVPLRACWRLGSAATGLDRRAKTVRLADGSSVAYDKLLVATGARARKWPGEGAGLGGVFTIRGRDEAAALRAALARASGRVLIVGGGLIGCEAASCCRALGLPVTLVDPNATPLARALGTFVGGTLAARMRAAGVDLRPGTQVRALEGEDGQVCRARLADGATIAVGLVIAALGAVRDTDWLAMSGLKADIGGLTCDGACRAITRTGEPDPDIFAAGDVARWPNPLYGGRLVAVEHWGNAVEQAAHAARNMLNPDDPLPYAHLPAFWSSQFGLNIKMVGLADGADSVAIVQGSRAAGRFLAVYGRDGRSIAALSFDEARWLPAYAERIAVGAAFPPIRGATDQPAVETRAPGFPPPRPIPTDRGRMPEAAHA